MAVFRELRGVNVKFLSSNPEKAHPWAPTGGGEGWGIFCRHVHSLLSLAFGKPLPFKCCVILLFSLHLFYRYAL